MRHLTPARFVFTTASLLGAVLWAAPKARAAALTWTGASADLTAAANWGGTAPAGNDLTWDATGTTKTGLTGTINGSSYTISGADDYTISGILQGAGAALTKDGAGTLTLSGANTYGGATNVNDGTLILGSGATGTLASTNLVIASDATFKYDSTATVTWAVNPTGSGTFWLAGGAGGVGRINSGSMNSGGGIDFVVDGILAANGNNRDLVFGSLSGASTGSIGEGGVNTGRDLTVGALNKDTTYAGTIIADLTLTKVGTGTQILTGANTYTGNTTITDGILVLSGSGRLADSNTAGQTLTVASGAVVNYTTASNNGLGNRQGAGSTWSVAGAINVNTTAANSLPTTITLTSGTLSSAQAGTIGGTYGSFYNYQNTVITATGNSFITGTGTGNFGMATGSNLTLSPTGASDSITASIIFSPGNGGTGGIIKAGAGTVILSGANTYTGTTTISAGTLSASNIVVSGGNSNLGNAATAVTLGSAGAQGTLSYTGNTATYIRGFTLGGAGGGRLNVTTAGQTLTVGTGAVTGTGLFTVGGAGNTTITSNLTHTGGLTKTNAGTLTLSGNNTYTGLTTVSAGILALNSAGANTAIVGDNNTATTDILIDGGTLRLLANEQIANNATIEMTSGAFDLNGRTETISRFVNNGGIFSTGTGQLIGTGASVVWSAGSNTVNNGGLVTDRHIQISGGTNTVEGGATGGVLQLDAPGVAPNGFEMSNGATLTLNSDAAVAGKLLLNGDVSVTDATTNTIANGLGFANHGQVDLDGAARTFTIAAGGALNIGADVVSGIAGGAVTKEGAGTLTLSGTNTYTGATTVNDGILLVNGTHNTGAAANTYSVTGGALGGTGIIQATNTVTIATSGTGVITGGTAGTVGGPLVAGNIGTLTLTATTVNLSGTYQFDVDYAGAGSADVLNITGATTVDTSGLTLALGAHSATPAAGSSYYIKIFESNVADAAYAAPGQHNFIGSVPGTNGLASYQSIVTWDNGKTFYLVPEPASFALLGLGCLLLLRRPSSRSSRRRGRQVQA